MKSGWADSRRLRYCELEKWWELIYSAYLLVTLFTNPWKNSSQSLASLNWQVKEHLVEHPQWDAATGWKNFLNNLRLISLPFFCFNLIQPWLKVFPIEQLSFGFQKLIALMNFFPSPISQTTLEADFQFSCA